MFDVPNLDDLSVDPAELREAAVVLEKLARYARKKATAMETRMAGNIPAAMVHEVLLERIYKDLPEWARW